MAGVMAAAALLAAAPAQAGDFAPAVDRYSPSLPYSVALGDLNRDGRLDAATAQYGNGGTSRLLNDGHGVLGAPAFTATGDRAYGATVADFDRNGTGDVAVANLGTNKVSVLRGHGDGAFDAPVDFATGTAPTALTAGDLNGDGNPDLAVVDNGSADVSVLLGRGDGGFQPARRVAVGGDYPQHVNLADYNRDGHLDMAVSVANASAVSVLLGRGDGSFGAPAQFRLLDPYNSSPVGLATADFNGDGYLDMAATSSRIASVFLGHGDGTFSTSHDYPAYPTAGKDGNAKDVVAADFNGDRKVDLAVANNGTTEAPGDLAVLPGRGDGSFGAATGYGIPATDSSDPWVREVGPGPNSVAAGDLNGDRRPDLAVSHAIDNHDSGGVAVLLNTGTWSPDAPPSGTQAKRAAWIRISSIRVRGRRVRVVVRRQPAARGTVRLYLHRRGRRGWRGLKRSSHAVSVYHLRLTPGRYKVRARFRGAGWRPASMTARRELRVRRRVTRGRR